MKTKPVLTEAEKQKILATLKRQALNGCPASAVALDYLQMHESPRLPATLLPRLGGPLSPLC